jgi:hypothetical protein
MDKYHTWIGVGLEGGGTLFVPGIEYVGGRLYNLGLLEDQYDFQILNIRMGLGLGAGGGVVACMIFNCLNLWELNDTNVEDWSFDVNIAVGEKWSSLIQGAKGYKLANILLKAAKYRKFNPKEIDTIRDFMSTFYGLYDIAATNGPKLIPVEIPGAGVGLELSAHFTLGGKIEILN